MEKVLTLPPIVSSPPLLVVTLNSSLVVEIMAKAEPQVDVAVEIMVCSIFIYILWLILGNHKTIVEINRLL